MPSTSTFGLRYPNLSDPANIPLDMQNLALDVENALSAIAAGATGGSGTPSLVYAENIVAGAIHAVHISTDTLTADTILNRVQLSTAISTSGLTAISSTLGTVTSGAIQTGYLSVGSGTGGTLRLGDNIPTTAGNISGIVGAKADGTVTFKIERDTGNVELIGTLKQGSTGLGNISGQVTTNQFQLAVGGHNYLQNSGFDSVVAFDKWTTAVTGTWAIDNTTSRAGTNSAKVTVTSTNAVRRQDLTLPKGRYVYTGWIKTSSVTGTGARLDYSPLSGTVTTVSATAPVTGTTTDWVRGQIVFDVTAGNATIGFTLNVPSGTGTAWFDDIQVEEGEVPTGWKPRIDEILPGTIKGGLGATANSMIAAGTIIGGDIAADVITADHLDANSIKAIDLNALSGTYGELKANYITSAMIKAGAITAGKISVTAIDSNTGNLNPNVVDRAQLVDNAVGTTEIEPGSITTGHMVANTINGDRITGQTIVAGKLTVAALNPDGSIATNAVGQTQIAPGSVTTGAMTAGTINGDRIQAGTITTNHLTATAIDGKTITGATIYSGSTRPRIEMAGGNFQSTDASGNYRVRIDSGGEPQILFQANASDSGNRQARIYSNVVGSQSNLEFRSPSAVKVLNFQGGGYITIEAGAFVVPSDSRLKENIREIGDPLKRLGSIKGVTFLRHGESDRRGGVVAEHVAKALPEAVGETVTGEKAHKTVDLGAVVGLLVGAVNELAGEVQNLRSQINKT